MFPHGKVYVGITGQKPEGRWQNGHGYKECPAMNRAISKWGWKNIDHDIIAEVETLEEAERLERYLIAWFKSIDPNYGYNILPGGDVAHNELTDYRRWLLGSGTRGVPVPVERRKRISDTLRGKYTGKKSPCSKPVLQYTRDGEFVQRWESVRAAARAGIAFQSGIVNAALGVRGYKSAGGFVWKYESDAEKVIDKAP